MPMTRLIVPIILAIPVLASVTDDLTSNVLPSSANLSSYSVMLAELKAADTACDDAWSAIGDIGALKARGGELRQAMIKAVGGFPETRCALNAQTTATVARDGYKVEKVLFESWPGVHVTANLFLPDSEAFQPPYPVAILPCGHSSNGKGSDAYQRGCVLAAKAGLACLIYDPYDQGERYQTSPKDGSCAGHNRVGALAALLGGSMARFRIWDGMRVIDYLETRQDIDASRIGCMGNSGGGTMTSLLMAVEPRLKTACPSCYISAIRDVCESIGPQDAEQNFFGQLALGVNHASFAFLQAPMPIRFMFCHGDFFPFAGAQRTYSLVSGVAQKCGIADRYSMTDVDGSHGWKESTRTSSVEWLLRWLNNDPSELKHDLAGYRALDNGFNLNSVDTGLSGTAHEVCSGGSVLNLPGERTVYDLMRDELKAAVAGRKKSITPAEVCQIAGIADPDTVAVVQAEVSRSTGNGYETVKETFTWPNGLSVPTVTFVPSSPSGAPVIVIGDGSRSDRASLVESWLAKGRPVTVADLIGTGEIGGKKHTFYSTAVPEEEVAIFLYMLGRSLIGEQAGEILALAKTLKARYGQIPEVVAKGRVCISAVHACAVRRDLVSSVTQVNPPESWETSVNSSSNIPFSTVVNGALKHYDWKTLSDRIVKPGADLALSVEAGVDWRVANLTVTIDNLTLPYSQSAELEITAYDSARGLVGKKTSVVDTNCTRNVAFDGLTPAVPYTFCAELKAEDPVTGQQSVMAKDEQGKVFGLKYDGWIDENIHTLRGTSAPLWTYQDGEASETSLSGEPAIGISAQAGGVAFAPPKPDGDCYVIDHRVCFAGPIGTRFDEVMATSKAAVAIVSDKGGVCRFVLLDNGAWHTNTQFVAEIDKTYDVRITIDSAKRGVLYDLLQDGGTIHLHSGIYAATDNQTSLLYRGNVKMSAIKGSVYKAKVAAVGEVAYDSVNSALDHAYGEVVTLLHDATCEPPEHLVFRINAAGYTLILKGGDYGAFAEWAKRHPEVLDGTSYLSARTIRVSSALDLDGLVSDDTLDALQRSEVKIVKAEFSDGVVDVTLKVDRLPVGDLAQMDYVSKIFSILGSGGEIENFCPENIEYVSGPVREADGAVRFRVRPNLPTEPNRFFFCGGVKL